MSQLTDLLEAVKETNLTKSQLEELRDKMTHLHSAMQLEMANVEKISAFFFDSHKLVNPEASDISIKRKWKVNSQGQREIELNRFIKLIVKEIDSLKSRLYSLY